MAYKEKGACNLNKFKGILLGLGDIIGAHIKREISRDKNDTDQTSIIKQKVKE